MMMLKTFVYLLIFINNLITSSCLICTRTNYGNSQNAVDTIKKTLKSLDFVNPEYDSNALPDFSKAVKEYQNGKKNEDVNLNITQLVTKYNYPVEQHQVITSDGYILNVFRIPNDGPAVFLMHGMASSSDDFVTPGPDAGLAFILADAGYDVWLGNNRGNVHSRHHQSISPESAEFWDFSFHEIGIYDIPAMIDYVLSATNQTKVLFVGHSQGTTAFFIMCSLRPEYNDKISLMVALSAVVFMGNVRSPLIRIFSPLSSLGDVLTNVLGIHEILQRDAFTDAFTSVFCGSPETAIICDSVAFTAVGFDYPQINATRLPVTFSHYPAGISVKQALHYGHNTASGKFAQYDYGLIKNLKKYGSTQPPDYPLEKVTCPVSIFYSLNDWLTSDTDIYKLLVKLSNVVEFYHVPYSMFNHFDYLIAKDVKEIIHEELKTLLSKYVV